MKKSWKEDNLLLKEYNSDYEERVKKRYRKLGDNMYYQIKDTYKDFESELIKEIKKGYEEPLPDTSPMELKSVNYNEKTRTLVVNITIGFKAYGDSYTSEEVWKGLRSSEIPNMFYFDKELSYNEANVIFPLGLVRYDNWYPVSRFEYYENVWASKPNKMYFVDRIIVNITKEYD